MAIKSIGWLQSPGFRKSYFTLLGLVAMLLVIFPFLWIVLSSLRGVDDFFSLELSNALPKALDLTSYKLALGRSQLVRWTANSLFIATGTTLLSLSVSVTLVRIS